MTLPKESKYTEGKIFHALTRLAIPIILANVLQTAYQLIDTFWLGRLGAHAVAAVSISFPILFFILSLGGGLTLAGTVLVSQYKGSQNQRMVDFISSQTVFIVFIVSVFLALTGFYTARPLMKLIGSGPEILEDAVSYFKVSSLGFVFLFLFFVFQSLLRGIGKVLLPVYVILVTVLLNLGLDPLFIYGYGPIPGYGVAGAAVASVITQGLSAVVGIYVLWKGKYGIQIHWSEMKLNFKWIKELFRLGIPSSLEQSARALGMAMMVVLVTSFNSEVVAAYGVGARLLSFVIVPALGLSIATTSLVGQNIGALQTKRAEHTGLLSAKVAFIGLTGVGILLFIFAEDLVRFFVPNEPKVIQDGALFIKIMGPSFGFLGVQQVMNGTFNGAGFTKASMFVSLLNLWVIRFPVGYYLAYHTDLGHVGIYWAFPISNWISSTAAFVYFRMGYWKKRLKGNFQESEKVS
ncbi:MATE family efflux transporter [Echinicola jeungdonensis]|uniref:Multidrug-efflux transporter n=1 Tax=Echinicola jeungdonensis TaxID=709343 RepID=A0ABV5J270_9BACT|nr:MATE family efflux transporter [Echinicola jeungdonensis]MDN3669050.1 MATE family efflux transporter [Echinicola jeungdonensis]